MRVKLSTVLGLSIVLTVPISARARAGRIDAPSDHQHFKLSGCRGYRDTLAGRSFTSGAQSLQALQALCQSRTSEAEGTITWRTVFRVIEGDTLILEGNQKVRLLGVNSPESVAPRGPAQSLGKQAVAFTSRMVAGKRVRLEFDETQFDSRVRTLAYVYFEDGTFLNAEIIKQGYGWASKRFPCRYLEEFQRYEREARDARRGIWKKLDATGPGNSTLRRLFGDRAQPVH